MQFIRSTTKNEAVEADTPEQAHGAEGKTIDIVVRVSPRPTPVTRTILGPSKAEK